MPLTAVLGSAVNLVIDGHSAVNGADIPEGSTVVITSNDPTIATAADVTVPAGGTKELVSAVTTLAVGSTDFHVVVTTPDTSVFEATDTLIVGPVPVPGLTHISATLVQA